MAEYIDIADMKEDQRIKMIGDAVTRLGRPQAFVTDDEPGKVERYCEELLRMFPNLEILERFDGYPIKTAVTVKVGIKVNQEIS